MKGLLSKTEQLSGLIERITYSDEDSGYTVARLKVQGRRDLVTAVGNLMGTSPGESVRLQGRWSIHPRYGEQFKIDSFQSIQPATIYGIRKYLGSGLIKGIGPVMAGRIVKQFGKKTLDIIENNVQKLSEVEGIGNKRIDMIQKAWEDQKEIREVMLFLQSHGVSSGYAAKIFKTYGEQSIAVVQDNPYRLAMDIFGIGFVTADSIAQKLGFPKNSPKRVAAGLIYLLHQLSDDGHVFYPYEQLVARGIEILEVDRDIVLEALGDLHINKHIVIEDLNAPDSVFQPNNKAVYLSKFYLCETRIARRIQRLMHSPKSFRDVDKKKAIDWIQAQLNITPARNQILAVEKSLSDKLMVLTGGPGTGKTTIIRMILKLMQKLGLRILLAAPTGRAAKRMNEATGFSAKTIHRLLEFSPSGGGFQKNEKKPLKCDALILDEVSMIDTVLMYHLLKAVPDTAVLILVGDVNQLPSVGAGNVLKDFIESKSIPVVELTEIFRQAKQSRIIVNAHRINSGKTPYSLSDDKNSDFYFIEQEDPERVLEIIMTLVKHRIPDRFGFDPVDDIQVLTPMHKGLVGAGNLNLSLQEALNPERSQFHFGHRGFKVQDKVMQIKNNYDKKVFNGDLGRISRVSHDTQEITVVFDGRRVSFDATELDEITLAYAVSVHKAQGSEYPAIVMPVLTQHYMLLQRNLLYTAVTRATKLVVLVGTRKALAIAVKNNKTQMRFTLLKERLQY
jgi:exodeoxyribonuclease V alpha subunit